MVDRNIINKLGLSEEKLDQQVEELFSAKVLSMPANLTSPMRSKKERKLKSFLKIQTHPVNLFH